MGDPTVKFNVDLSYGCTLSYTLQELKDVCNSINTPVANLEIYKNLNNIDTFGKFGNADVYKTNVSAALISPSFLLLLIFRFLLTVIRTGRKSSRRLHWSAWVRPSGRLHIIGVISGQLCTTRSFMRRLASLRICRSTSSRSKRARTSSNGNSRGRRSVQTLPLSRTSKCLSRSNS